MFFDTFNLRFVAIALALFLVGCSQGPPQGMVAGTVTLDGQPIKNGAIQFVPVDGNTAVAGGAIKDGQYSVTVPVNKCKVAINAADDAQHDGPAPNSFGDDAPLAKELIPAKYNVRTKLVVDVQEGENQHDFPLTSR